MNIFETLRREQSTIAAISADMRGNTDETWSRTLDWLVQNRLLAPGYGLQRRVALPWRGAMAPSANPEQFWTRSAGSRATFSGGSPMSTEDKPEKPSEESAEWHRARAKSLRKNGFTKMAEEHEQIAQAIERRRQQAK